MDTVGLHVQEEDSQPFGSRGTGPGSNKRVRRELTLRDPFLLSVDHPMFAVWSLFGRGGEPGDVGAG